MSLNIGDNFKYLGEKFLDARESFDTLEEMNACTDVPKGFITICYEDNKRYEYDGSAWIEYVINGDFTGYAKIEDIPTKISQLENDKKYTDEDFVTTKIAEAQLSGGEVNLNKYATIQYVNDTIAIGVKNLSLYNEDGTTSTSKTIVEYLNEIIKYFISENMILDNKIKYYHILRGKINPQNETGNLSLSINNKEYNNITYISMLNVDYEILTTFIFANEGSLRIESPFICEKNNENIYTNLSITDIGNIYELKSSSSNVEGDVSTGQYHTHSNKDILDMITSELIESWNNKSDVTINDDRNNPTTISTYSSEMIENILLEKDESITAIADDLNSMDSRVVYLEETNLTTQTTIEKNRKDIDKILEAVDTPPTFTKPTLSLSVNKSTIEHNIATSITITPTFRQNDGGAITNYTLMKGATSLVDSTTTQAYTDTITLSHNSSITYTATVYYGDGQSKTSTFGVEYAGLSASNVSANSTIRAYALSYYGVIDGTEVTDVTALTSRLGTSKGYTVTYNMANQRSVYIYPKSFGALTSIKDVNNFDYINSYTRSEMIYNNVDYYVYILTDPVEIVGFKQSFS